MRTRGFAGSSTRLVLLLCCLLTSTLQVYVAQTHVHIPPYVAHFTAGQPVVDAIAATSIDRDGPLSRRPGTERVHLCPLCQVVAHAGALLTPAHTEALTSCAAGSVVPLDVAPLVSIAAVSYNWQGRGPPLV